MEEKATLDELDQFVLELGSMIKDQEKLPAVDIPEREAEVLYVYHLLKRLAIGNDIQVSYGLHTPFRSYGFISIIGESVEFQRMDLVAKAFAYTDNVEIYARADDKMQIDLCFYGLSKLLRCK